MTDLKHLPRSIFDIAEIYYSPSLENYDEFYTRFRSSIGNNLKKPRAIVTEETDLEHLPDEIISPTFEEVIILWCLEKIDHSLPLLAKNTFINRLDDYVTLKELHTEIFQSIPELLSKKEVIEKLDPKKIDDSSLLKEENIEVHVKCEDEMDFDGPDLFPFDVGHTESLDDDLDNNDDTVVEIEDETVCKECNKSFPSRKRMLAHQAYHRMDPIQCEFCLEQLKNRSYLQIHIRRAHKATFTCRQCHTVLDNQLMYERHVKDFHRELYKGRYDLKVRKYPHLCRYCHKTLSSHKALREHTFKHIEDKDICLVGENIDNLKSDYNKENEENKVDASLGGSKEQDFSERDIEELEMEHLFDEEDFVCNDCGKELPCKKSLLSHQISHRYDPCTCEFCDEEFRNRRSLRLHIRRIHKATFCCKDCDRTLVNQLMFERHIKDLHRELYKGRYDLRVKRFKHLCRYCYQPQVSHQALKEHTFDHIEKGEIQLNNEAFATSIRDIDDIDSDKDELDAMDVDDKENSIDRNGSKHDESDPDFENDSQPKKRGRGRRRKKGSEGPLYQCKGCGKKFKRYKTLDRHCCSHKIKDDETINGVDDHMKQENGASDIDSENEAFEKSDLLSLANGTTDSKYECNECDKRFPSKAWLTDHMTKHENDPCTCEFCDKPFQNRRVLQGHIRNLHRVTFTCGHCRALISGQNQYEKHLKDFHKDNFLGDYDTKVKAVPFICRYCYETQDSHETLKEHIFKHKENKEIDFSMKVENASVKESAKVFDNKVDEQRICDVCGKSVNIRSMPAHMKSHIANSLSCEKCNIEFEEKRLLRMHMKKHKSNEVVASCEECGKTFTRHDSLKNHMKLHRNNGEKLKCETCKRTFFTKKSMGSHVCKHNSCDICGEKFQRVRNLEMHKKGHYGEEIFNCGKCESIFMSKKRLREHVRELHEKEKKHRCDICDKRFIMKSGLVEHIRTHTGEKPYKCDECGMAFTQKGNLDTHKKLHNNEMPYQCLNCKQRFRQTGDLKRHREFLKCGFTQEDFYNSEEYKNSLKL